MNKQRGQQILTRDGDVFDMTKDDVKHINELKEKHTYQDLVFLLKNISCILNTNHKYKDLDEFVEDMTGYGIYDEERDW